jgi:hypothetical protein
MEWAPKKAATTTILLGIGFVFARIIYLFFDPYGICDVIIFTSTGYWLGNRLPPNRYLYALLLCLPSIVLCLFFAYQNGYSAIINGIGTVFVVSIVVMPIATFIGIFIKRRRTIPAH